MEVLKKSIDVFSKELLDEITSSTPLLNEKSEFGFYDHTWLSTLILTWLKGHKKRKTGVSSIFYEGDYWTADEAERALLDAAAIKKRDQVFDELIEGFQDLAYHGKLEEDTEKFDLFMKKFSEHYLCLWD